MLHTETQTGKHNQVTTSTSKAADSNAIVQINGATQHPRTLSRVALPLLSPHAQVDPAGHQALCTKRYVSASITGMHLLVRNMVVHTGV